MPRAISMRHSTVSKGDRDNFRTRARSARSFFSSAKCQYWVFEDTTRPGAFVEFVEAADAATLTRAREAEDAAAFASGATYTEVDLT